MCVCCCWALCVLCVVCVVDDAAGPIRLDINPVAWRQTDAAGSVGDITFVYTGDVG